MPNPFKDILNSRTFQRIRFGGIVGKLALLGVFGLVTAGAIGVRASDPRVQSLCVACALGFALIMSAGILAFGFKHPEQATLEGTEILALQHVQQMRAKDLPNPAQEEPRKLEGLGTRPTRDQEQG